MSFQTDGKVKKFAPRGRELVLFSLAALVVFLGVQCGPMDAEWPTYRHDSVRSGGTSENLDFPMGRLWMYESAHPPQPAWYEPTGELPRMHVDRVFHTVAGGGRVFFGSQVDGCVQALDTGSGKILWTFFTDGPVRFAPTLWQDKIFFGSDDGWVYALKASNGRLVWKYRAGPTEEKIIGNENLISLWPVRTGVLVIDEKLYSTAGVFPYEGLYIFCLDARSGDVIWTNDTIGDRAHELLYGGVAPHGYLVASETTLYVPSGRAAPAAFDRLTGEFLYYIDPIGGSGGTWALVDQDAFVTGVASGGTPQKNSYDPDLGIKTNDAYAFFPGIDMAVTGEVTYVASPEGILALDRSLFKSIEKKIGALQAEKESLQSMLSDLQRRASESEDFRNRTIYRTGQMDELAADIQRLAEEQEALKSSVVLWKHDCGDLSALISVGKSVAVGGENIVFVLDGETGERLWFDEVDGEVHGLSAVKGRLFASTDSGKIYAFGRGGGSGLKEILADREADPFPQDDLTPVVQAAAKKILDETGIQKGYALVLDAGTGRLAYELAKQSELKIVGIETDPDNIKQARKILKSTGVYGKQVVIGDFSLSSLPAYFANLIVSEKILTESSIDYDPQAVAPLIQPYGGRVVFGRPSTPDRPDDSLETGTFSEWLTSAGLDPETPNEEDGSWVTAERGELVGAGSWSQQYGNPGNTSCTEDDLVKGPMGMLWFGAPGPKGMVERHGRAASPVSLDGKLFTQGEEVIIAQDAYNGTILWKKEIPGAVRVKADVDCGNLAVTEKGLFVAAFDKCYRLDLSSGETLNVYDLPKSIDGKPRRWAYISSRDNILFGSAATPLKSEYGAVWKAIADQDQWKPREEVPKEYWVYYDRTTKNYPRPNEDAWMDFERSGTLYRTMADFPRGGEYTVKGAVTKNMMTSDLVFALDVESGRRIWSHQGRQIAHISISQSDGNIFFADKSVSASQRDQALSWKRGLIQRGVYVEGKDWLDHLKQENIGARDIDIRRVTALDADSGRKIWERPVDLTGCCGDRMTSMVKDGLLLFFGNFGNHDWWRWTDGSMKWRRITAMSTENGNMIWSRALNYRTRPVAVGDRLIIEPWACTLKTGEIIMRDHPITGEKVPWEFLRAGHCCSVSTASAHSLFYRSASTAFYDLDTDRGFGLFGAVRGGCLINMIPASGLLLFPEASAGCSCSYPIRCSLAMIHKPERVQPWTVFITQGSSSPAKNFAINFGAPADMTEDDGTVWFGYPPPKNDHWAYNHAYNHFPNYGVRFNLQDEVLDGMGYYNSDFRAKSYEGSDKPWLFASGCLGLLRCEVPLIEDSLTEPKAYTVRLGFSASQGEGPDQRVFDIKLQGNLVAEAFDTGAAAGTSDSAVIKEFTGIKVTDNLKLELVPKAQNPTAGQAPILNFIQVVSEDDDRRP